MSDDAGTPLAEEDPLDGAARQEPTQRQQINGDDLQRMLEGERRRSRELEARLRQSDTELATERGARKGDIQGRFESDLNAARTAGAASTADADRLQGEAEAHFAEGRWAEGTKAVREAARAEAAALNWHQRAEWLEKNKDIIVAQQAPRQQPSRVQQEAPPAGQAQLDWSQYSDRQRAWIERHPQYMRDGQSGLAYRTKAAARHYEALEQGIEVDSDDYFRFLDDGLGGGRRAVEDPTQQTSEREPFQPDVGTRGAMPVQRSTAAPGRTRPADNRSITLTPEEREAADASFPDEPRADTRQDDGTIRPSRYRMYHDAKAQLKAAGRL